LTRKEKRFDWFGPPTGRPGNVEGVNVSDTAQELEPRA
jgi:hypothetical protein